MTHCPKNVSSLHADPSVFLLIHCVLHKALKPSPGFARALILESAFLLRSPSAAFQGQHLLSLELVQLLVYLRSVTKARSLPLGIDLQFSLMPWGPLLSPIWSPLWSLCDCLERWLILPTFSLGLGWALLPHRHPHSAFLFNHQMSLISVASAFLFFSS